MAKSRKKSSSRAKAAKQTVEEVTASEGTATSEDADRSGAATASSAKDPVKTSGSGTTKGSSGAKRSGAKDPSGKGSAKTTGGDVAEKAKDASSSSSKKAAAAEAARAPRRRVAADAPNPAWLAPTAVVLLLVGLAYLVTYYLSSGTLPLPIGDWNLAAGFGVMLVGGGLLMFWK